MDRRVRTAPTPTTDTASTDSRLDVSFGADTKVNDGSQEQEVKDGGKPEVDEKAKHRRDVLRRELSKMAEKDENEKLRKQARRKELEREAKKHLEIQRLERAITILPGVTESKRDVRRDTMLEERLSLKDKQDKLKAESNNIQKELDKKFGITDLPKGKALVGLAEEFYSNQRMPNEHLPSHVTKELTTEEINDFRLVFEMFDVKNRGYITSDDLKRVAAMLGFTAKKKVFKEMIDFISTNKRGRVNFVSFLELVVKVQGDGPDPLDEVKKGFSLLDKGDKGYLTFADIRAASEDLEVPLSNRAIRDMLSDADMSGDGTVTMEEFKNILMQTGSFRSLGKPL